MLKIRMQDKIYVASGEFYPSEHITVELSHRVLLYHGTKVAG